MPRRKKTKEEKERIIEKPSISQEEANSLEQRLEKDEEKIDLSELREFLQEPGTSASRSSPSLSKINAPQRNPVRLERNLIEDTNTPITNDNFTNGEEEGIKYIPSGGGTEEKKYFHYNGKIADIIPRTEIPNLGKGRPFERREVGFENSPQARIGMQESFEKYAPPQIKRVDKENLGKENPLQKKEIKYHPEKY